MGFSFVNPFMPLFIQELGAFTTQQAAFWAGIAISASGIAMFFSAPLWGIVADRWGRKPMVLRAMFGAGVVLALVGLAPNIYYVVALRFTQGLLSGTVAAASALVAASTPRNKMPFAMGLLMVAVFGGQSFGPLAGGFIADSVGYKAAFFITGGLLFSGGFIVLLFVKEKFERPAKGQSASLSSLLRQGAESRRYGSNHVWTSLLLYGCGSCHLCYNYWSFRWTHHPKKDTGHFLSGHWSVVSASNVGPNSNSAYHFHSSNGFVCRRTDDVLECSHRSVSTPQSAGHCLWGSSERPRTRQRTWPTNRR